MIRETWTPRWGERTLLMGVINVTPDSFSGDGIGTDPHRALELALRLEEEGADVLDIGGESTRPGYTPVAEDEELRRVIPAVEAITAGVRAPVSVDTNKAAVAREALEAGAQMINDVSGSRDPRLAEAVAAAEAWLILVHNGPVESDPLPGIVRDLQRQLEAAEAAGVSRERVVVDPGLGMGKVWLDNLAIMRDLEGMRALGCPVLVGPSRKGMIGRVLGVSVDDRVEGTIALVSACIAGGADMVRVHDVREMARATRMMDALVR